jgi:hypothetical protein
VNHAGFLRTHDLADRRVVIGDPGQIDTFANSSIRPFAADPMGPHVSAPKAKLAGNLARPFDLPLTRRLPQDTVELLRPAFYPTLSFNGIAPAGQRRIDACACGSTSVDNLLDQALAAGSLSMIALPHDVRPRVDPEIVDLMADLVDRLVVRQFHVFDNGEDERPITPADIGVVAYHKDQVASLRAALGRQYRRVHVETANRFKGWNGR